MKERETLKNSPLKSVLSELICASFEIISYFDLRFIINDKRNTERKGKCNTLTSVFIPDSVSLIEDDHFGFGLWWRKNKVTICAHKGTYVEQYASTHADYDYIFVPTTE